ELGTFGLTAIPGFHGGFLVTETPGVIARVEEIRNFTGVVQIDLLFTLASKTGPGNGPLRSEVGDSKVAVEEEIVCQ
ncbi:MAG: hypothetical protein ABSH31_19575, partial [Bryobacteraceae bacterium]